MDHVIDGPPIQIDSRYMGPRLTDTEATWHPHDLNELPYDSPWSMETLYGKNPTK